MIKTGIIGVSGYSGRSVLEILIRHPQVRVSYVSANNTTGPIDDIWPQLKGQTRLNCQKYNLKDLKSSECDVVFLAVPHKTAMSIAPEILKSGIKIIDLSGDYRLDRANDYKKWYGVEHIDTAGLKKAVYGLPELYREQIKKSSFISNPGCYPTAGILGLLPLVSTHSKIIESIIIDAKSGVTGAGRKAHVNFSFSELNENFKAYKVLNHQHTPEIELYINKVADIKHSIDFVPHLLPIDRGIQETIYVRTQEKLSLAKIHTVYKKFYKTEKFVRVLDKGAQPEIKNVAHSNFCDIGLASSSDGKLLVITSVIDNLIKGAAGQAVQNMNIMFGFKETEAL